MYYITVELDNKTVEDIVLTKQETAMHRENTLHSEFAVHDSVAKRISNVEKFSSVKRRLNHGDEEFFGHHG